MIKVRIDSGFVFVKETLSECNYNEVASIMLAQIGLINNPNDIPLKREIVGILTNLTKNNWAKLPSRQRLKFFDLCRWAFNCEIQNKPFDYFEFLGVKYFLPAERFSDTTSIEWALSNFFLTEFYETQDPELKKKCLAKIVAIFCRPERKDLKVFQKSNDWNNDIREPYNDALMEDRAKIFDGLNEGIMIAVYKWIIFMNKELVEQFSELFKPSTDDNPPIFSNGMGYIAMLQTIAKTNIHGNISEVYRKPIFEVILSMDIENIQNKEQQRLINENETRGN